MSFYMYEPPEHVSSRLPKVRKKEGGKFFFHIGLYPPESKVVSKVILLFCRALFYNRVFSYFNDFLEFLGFLIVFLQSL